jgi:hypothetical protein
MYVHTQARKVKAMNKVLRLLLCFSGVLLVTMNAYAQQGGLKLSNREELLVEAQKAFGFCGLKCVSWEDYKFVPTKGMRGANHEKIVGEELKIAICNQDGENIFNTKSTDDIQFNGYATKKAKVNVFFGAKNVSGNVSKAAVQQALDDQKEVRIEIVYGHPVFMKTEKPGEYKEVGENIDSFTVKKEGDSLNVTYNGPLGSFEKGIGRGGVEVDTYVVLDPATWEPIVNGTDENVTRSMHWTWTVNVANPD